MTRLSPRHFSCALLLLLLAGLLLFLPGLSGPWLVDDHVNLDVLRDFLPGQGSYADIITSNHSGPLGRPVAMASFVANHALGLFSTPALKATNLVLHGVIALLLFALLNTLLARRLPPDWPAPRFVAAAVTLWWLCLPLHTSTVLYIVQRMTLIATLFSLAACLAYVWARPRLPRQPLAASAGLLLCFGVFLPLAVFAKESAFCTLAWLALIELFFFQPPRRHLLNALVIGVLLLCLGCALFPPAFLADGFLGRDFSLSERLLTQPRVLFTYISDILVPNAARMGLFHDDFVVSRQLTAPLSTLFALAGLLALLALALRLANSPRWWPLSFGLLFYFSGHLVESTVIALELYFEHRNYLPAAGLLLAVTTAALNLWPWRRSLLLLTAAAFLVLLAFATWQRASIWGSEHLLLLSSSHNHPASVRARTDFAEHLFMQGELPAALATALEGVQRNPEAAGIFYLQVITMHCRSANMPPAALINAAGQHLVVAPTQYISLNIGLSEILGEKQDGECGHTDFSAWRPRLVAVDSDIRKYYGERRGTAWLLRYTLSNWLQELGDDEAAYRIRHDIWDSSRKADMPTVGLELAKALAARGDVATLRRVLDELTAVTPDAPPDFLQDLRSLRQAAEEKRKE